MSHVLRTSSDFTLAHMAIQTDDSEVEELTPIPEELRQTRYNTAPT